MYEPSQLQSNDEFETNLINDAESHQDNIHDTEKSASLADVVNLAMSQNSAE